MTRRIVEAFLLLGLAACATTDADGPSSSLDVTPASPAELPAIYERYEMDVGPEVDFAAPTELAAAVLAADQAAAKECPSNDRDVAFVSTRLDAFSSHSARLVELPVPITFYKVQATSTGCGKEPRIHNALISTVDAGRALTITLGFPGTTRSLPAHQPDFTPQLAVATALLNPDCSRERMRSSSIADTRVDGLVPIQEYLDHRGPNPPPAGVTVVEAWRETWTISSCGNVHEVPVFLGSDDRGGLGIAISVEVGERGDEA